MGEISSTLVDFIIGAVIGFLASIPLGPIGVLCVQRTINKKFIGGYISALGAATADTMYAALALFALSFIMPYIDNHQTLISILGGGIMFIIGLNIFLKKLQPTAAKEVNISKMTLVKDYFSIFFLTISNPAYMSIFLVLFASFKVDGETMNFIQHLSTILGVLVGAATWWLILTFSVSLVRKKVQPRHIYYINKIAGVLISLLGIVAIVNAIMHFV